MTECAECRHYATTQCVDCGRDLCQDCGGAEGLCSRCYAVAIGEQPSQPEDKT